VQESLDTTTVRANDTLANERTYLAYVRTSIAFIGFGFVIARFSLFEREFTQLVHAGAPPHGMSTAFGTGMALFGVLVALLGAWRHASTDRGLRQGRVVTLTGTAGYVLSIVITAIGAVVAFALLSSQ
jgi:putative membrane protein